MKISIILILILALVGCNAFPKYQTPYIVPNVALNGEHWISGNMIQSTHERYWLSYQQALKAEGYLTREGEKQNNQDIKKSINFTIDGFEPSIRLPIEQRQSINKMFFEEGYGYARSICLGYFQKADYTKSHRSFGRKLSNISGGVLSAALGLAESSVKAVSGVGVAFSALDSSFDSYEASFLASPQIGLLEKATIVNMDATYSTEKSKNFDNVVEVLTSLSKIAYHCSQTGMQALVDESVNEKMQRKELPNLNNDELLKQKLVEGKELLKEIRTIKEDFQP